MIAILSLSSRISLSVVEKEAYRVEQCAKRLAAEGYSADESHCFQVDLREDSGKCFIPGLRTKTKMMMFYEEADEMKMKKTKTKR